MTASTDAIDCPAHEQVGNPPRLAGPIFGRGAYPSIVASLPVVRKICKAAGVRWPQIGNSDSSYHAVTDRA
jgi:hypothetical protein